MGACCGYIKGPNDPTKTELIIQEINRIDKNRELRDDGIMKSSLINHSNKETSTKNEGSIADREAKDSTYNMINTPSKDVNEDNSAKKAGKKPELKLKVEDEQSKKEFKQELEKTKQKLLNPTLEVGVDKRKSRTSTQITGNMIDLSKKPLDKKALEIDKLKNLPEIKLDDIKIKAAAKPQSNENNFPFKRSYTVACDSEDATMHDDISQMTNNQKPPLGEKEAKEEKEKEAELMKKQIENLKKQGTGTFVPLEKNKDEEEKDNDNDTKYSASPRKSLLKRCKTIGAEKKEKSKKKVKFVGLENKPKKKKTQGKRR